MDLLAMHRIVTDPHDDLRYELLRPAAPVDDLSFHLLANGQRRQHNLKTEVITAHFARHGNKTVDIRAFMNSGMIH